MMNQYSIIHIAMLALLVTTQFPSRCVSADSDATLTTVMMCMRACFKIYNKCLMKPRCRFQAMTKQARCRRSRDECYMKCAKLAL